MTKKPKARMDEIELAKSIFDEIVEETESEDWNKKKKPKKKSVAKKQNNTSEKSSNLKTKN